MKKYVVALALLAAASGYAADEVYSANIVGFTKISVAANEYTLVGMNFSTDDGESLLTDVVGTNNIPNGSILYTFDGLEYAGEAYYEGYGWFPGTNTISCGEAFWFKSPSDTELVLSGTVVETNAPMEVYEGLQMISFPYPVSVTISNTIMGVSVSAGDVVYKYDGTSYTGYAYYEDYGWYPELTIEPGEGLLFKAKSDTTWTETVPFTTD